MNKTIESSEFHTGSEGQGPSLLEKTGSVMPMSIERLLKCEVSSLNDRELVDLSGMVIDNLGIVGLDTQHSLAFLERTSEVDELNKDLRLGLRALLEAERNAGRLIYDRITGLAKEDPLRLGLVEAIKTRIENDRLPPVHCLHLDVDQLHSLNRKYGREKVNVGFGALGKHVVEEINKFAVQLPEDCLVYAFRKGETGDELLVFFIGLPYDQAKRLDVFKDSKWPWVQLGEDRVQITATATWAHSVELEERLSPEEKGKIGPMLKALDQLTEKRLSQLKEQRRTKR